MRIVACDVCGRTDGVHAYHITVFNGSVRVRGKPLGDLCDTDLRRRLNLLDLPLPKLGRPPKNQTKKTSNPR